MKRRNFLKSSLGILGSSILPSVKLFASAVPKQKKLIVVFNTGGNDGINMLVPYSDSFYAQVRPSLAIPAPDTNNPNAAISLGDNGIHDGVSFGLHPAMSGLKNIWDDGNLAFMPATHCGPNPNRSHFYQFGFVGAGRYTTNTGLSDNHGWISRYMNHKYPLGPQDMQTYDFAAGALNVFNGWETLGISDPSSIYYGMNSAQANTYIDKVEALQGTYQTSTEETIAKLQAYTTGKLRELQQYNFTTPPQNGAVYPEDSRLAAQLSQTTTLLRSRAELEIVFLDNGGWDTHADQAERHNVLLGDLSDSLEAFYTDMGTEMENITILVVSEFGRTAHENDSKTNDGTPTPGTDHGHAYCSFVIGNNVNGGIYGGWPGLDPATQLAEGRYLAQSVDYRDVISECLSTLEGGSPETAFEQYTRTNVGFMM